MCKQLVEPIKVHFYQCVLYQGLSVLRSLGPSLRLVGVVCGQLYGLTVGRWWTLAVWISWGQKDGSFTSVYWDPLIICHLGFHTNQDVFATVDWNFFNLDKMAYLYLFLLQRLGNIIGRLKTNFFLTVQNPDQYGFQIPIVSLKRSKLKQTSYYCLHCCKHWVFSIEFSCIDQ